MTVLMADGITSTAAFESDTCPVPEETAGDDITPMQLVTVLLIVGAIVGALFQQVVITCFGSRKPATCDAQVQVNLPRKRTAKMQTDPLQVQEYWKMSLHQVQEIGKRRMVHDASKMTRMELTGILIQQDFATVH